MTKVYFASDLHLKYNDEASIQREWLFVQWLDMVKQDASQIYLLGDMFDFWFEYKEVIPPGFFRLFGKLAELTDRGIEIHYFVGNHDMWMRNHLSKHLGLILHHGASEIEIGTHRFFIGHGHELAEGVFLKLLFKLYKSRFFQKLFSSIHPRWGIACGNYLSARNHNKKTYDNLETSDRNKYLVEFSRKKLLEKHYDYFIFGHTHTPDYRELSSNIYFVNTGDWVSYRSYAVFDGQKVSLLQYSNE